MFASDLESALADVPDPSVRARLAAFGTALAEENARVNLTAARDAAAIASHIRDSLTLLPFVCGPYVDVGSGGGFPALPIALATGVATTCIDSVGKKVRALRAIAERLASPGDPLDVTVVLGRAETLGRDERYRERFGFATARAVGPAPTVLELLVPLLVVGGTAMLQRGALDAAERHATADAALVLGAELVEEIALPGDRRLLRVVKRLPTGHRFPRKAGVPEKRPLCMTGTAPDA